MNELSYVESPIHSMDVSFRSYMEKRRAQEKSHMGGNGLPDYAYSADYEHRKKLDAIPGLYSLARKYCVNIVSLKIQEFNREALAVGPNQFPEVYEIGRDCANRLGIGIPNIYIYNYPGMNAFTYAFDDVEPIIVVYSGLLERMTQGELRYIIGHECGHIHNQHSIYGTLESVLMGTGANAGVSVLGTLGNLLAMPIVTGANAALMAWSRAAEVTADRAGMICCERLEDVYSAMAKLMYGGAFGDYTVNYDEMLKQLKMLQGNITRFGEIFDSHPSTARRLKAGMLFVECERFYEWRPDLKQPGQELRSMEETDTLCKQYISVAAAGKGE